MRLKLTGVEVSFGERHLLRGVDLAVSMGESVSIVGPSGSGKLTLLAVCGGLLPPDEGRVVAEDAGGIKHAPEDVSAFVLQTNTVFPHRSATENVALGGVRLGTAWGALVGEAQELLDRMGMGPRSTPLAAQLSGGEVQRVVIARALIGRAPFVLADEPTGQLDSATSRLITEFLLSGASRAGIVIVTHDDAVARQCERRFALIDGVLEPA